MKKTLILAALVLVSAGCFAQKKNVSKARNIIMAETEQAPDYDAARIAIDEAMRNEETAGQAETFYVAGLIGYQENLWEHNHVSQDWTKRGKAVLESIGYWKQADEIAMTPTYDKKGKPHVQIRYRKMIAEKMMDYYVNQELIQYGVVLNDNRDYKKAFEAFMTYLSIPDMPMMQDEKTQAKMPKDTTYYLYKYYAARMAYDGKDLDLAISMFRELLDGGHEAVHSGEFLYQSYIDKGDSATANTVLDECIRKFPQEAWFLQNRINNLVQTGKADEAITYLDQAIAMDPQAQYYNSKGSILNMLKRYDEAIPVLEEAAKLEPENAGIQSNLGFVYFDHANQMLEDATNLDNKAFNKVKAEADKEFQKALPYFKKAFELESENYQYRTALRQLYYRLQMMDEYEKLGAY